MEVGATPAALIAVALFTGSVATATQLASKRVTLEHDGQARSYQLVAPAAQTPAPLIIALHGGSGNGTQLRRSFQLDDLATRRGFMVAYPEALGGTWNDGRDAVNFQDTQVDDVGYLLAVIEDIASRQPLDRSRIYALGVSNGGMITQRLACEQTVVFAAFATFIAQLPEPLAQRCAPSAPAPVLLVNGTADPLVPFDGGSVLRTRGRVISSRATVDFWRDHNGCQRQSTRKTYDRDPTDSIRTHVEVFDAGCRQAPVVFVTVEGGGHTWPGGPQYLMRRLIGPASNDLDSRTLLLDFFASQRR